MVVLHIPFMALLKTMLLQQIVSSLYQVVDTFFDFLKGVWRNLGRYDHVFNLLLQISDIVCYLTEFRATSLDNFAKLDRKPSATPVLWGYFAS